MDYEKKYKEALKRASNLHKDAIDMDETIRAKQCEIIFPELKESKDERVREALIELVRMVDKYPIGQIFGYGDIKYSDMIDWLEKQGEKLQYWKPSAEQLDALDYAYNSCPDTERGNYYEGVLETIIDDLHKLSEKQGKQKPSDKIEPKFKVGDWIIDVQGVSVNQIIGYEDEDDSYFIKTSRSQFYLPMKLTEKSYRLWTIQDAKDGDVLAVEDKNFATPFVAIYKSLGHTVYEDTTFNSHCFIGFDGNFYKGEEGHVIEGIHPATKEQRDLLFTKMKEAGYEWDADKKELKKIVSYCQENCKGYQETGKCFFDEECQAKKAAEKKELKKIEDKPLVIDEGKSEMDYCFTKMMNGEKVNPAWTEEDEEKLNQLHKLIVKKAYEEYGIDTEDETLYGKWLKLDNWLKSLKDRVQLQWKPSDEQMQALAEALSLAKNCGEESAFDLRTLHEQLKKL